MNKKLPFFLSLVIIITSTFILSTQSPHTKGSSPQENLPTQGKTMQITSDAFSHNTAIPALYTCDGKNINPPLNILNVPPGCQSLALIMEDPDVPTYLREDGMWDHWLVWNIPPSTTSIAENSTPSSSIGRNSSGTLRYTGPCPPDKTHRYFFKLYALDKLLDLPSGATKQQLLNSMQKHILAEAQLIGLYTRVR